MRPKRQHFSRTLLVPALIIGLVGIVESWAGSQDLKEPGALSTGETGPPVSSEMIRALLKDGKYREAEQAARQFLERIDSASSQDPTARSQALDLLVEALWRGGKFRAAETRELAQRAVSSAKEVYAQTDPKRAVSLTNLGNVLSDNRDFEGARSAYDAALELREKAFGPDDPAVASSLVDVGRLCEAQRDIPGARLAWSRSLAIYEKSVGPRDPLTAASLGNLARVAYLEQDLATAKALMERSLSIREETLGPDHPDTARTKTNFCNILIDLGDYGRAERLAREALAAREKGLGPDHPQVASTLTQLAHILYLRGDSEDAIPIERRAVGIVEKSYSPEDPRLAREVNNLGLLLQSTGDWEGARENLEKSLRIFEKTTSPGSPDVAETLSSLASLLEQTGQRAEARANAERAAQIFEAAFGADSSGCARPLDTLARIAWAEGDRSAAVSNALRESRILRSQFEITASVLTEREAMQYEAVLRQGLDMSLSVLMSETWPASQGKDAAAAWNEVVQSRALVLNELATRHKVLDTSSSLEVRELAAAFEKARSELASLQVQGPGPGGPAEYQEKLAKARARREAAERSLAEKSSAYRVLAAERQVGLDSLLTTLPKATALVSYVVFDRISDPPADSDQLKAPLRTAPTYMAFVFAPGEAVQARLLGGVTEIDLLVEAWRRSAGAAPAGLPASHTESERNARLAGERLRRRVWDPLQSYIRGAKQVFIVPDGALHLVNFSALPVGATQYLLEKGRRFHYLSAERDLASSPPEGDALEHPLIYGGPDFDNAAEAPPAQPVVARDASPAGSTRGSAPVLQGGSPTACEKFHRVRFENLPGSREEAEALASLLGQGPGSRRSSPSRIVQPHTGAEADEKSFKDLAPKSTLLHVATHGFFLEGDCISGVSEAHRMAREGRLAGQEPKPVLGESPLLLSGLALAGANQRLDGNPCKSCDDGILTAEEIASLNLSGVDWAVLSSCDTGIGRIQSGEGVLGLRRAFHVAGAKTLIMSLWKVDDESTREWMRCLYEERLQGMSTVEAVHNASLTMLKLRRSRGKSTHPFTWGAFVAAGNWR